MTDYQLLFLIMTIMALCFMVMADHYYTKYKRLKSDVNMLLFQRDAMSERYRKFQSLYSQYLVEKAKLDAEEVQFKEELQNTITTTERMYQQ